jgi:multicomponent Na+:H+ antiporter subunit F
MIEFLNAIVVILIITTLLCLYRALKGPTVWDRALAINVIGTKTVVILVLIGFIYKSVFLDIAITYAMINFVSIIAISRFL